MRRRGQARPWTSRPPRAGSSNSNSPRRVTTPSSTTRWSTPNAEPTASSRSPTDPIAAALATRSPPQPRERRAGRMGCRPSHASAAPDGWGVARTDGASPGRMGRRPDGAERSRSGRCVSAFRLIDSQILQVVEMVLQVVVLSKMSAQARPGKAVPSAWRTAAAKGVSVISQSALSTVRETLPAVGAAIGDITPIFYRRMFTARPDLLRDLFNRGNQAQGEQQKALAGAIAAYASLLVSDDAPNIDAMMSRIANK